jgi:hypothetical protein
VTLNLTKIVQAARTQAAAAFGVSNIQDAVNPQDVAAQ